MATRPVRFEFSCEKGPKQIFAHSIPSTLIGAAAQTNPQYVSEFAGALGPIMQAHEASCRAASSATCQACGQATVKVLQTPMSWLHIVDDPFVNVWVNPVCGRAACEQETRLQIQDLMRVMMSGGGAGEEGGATPCKVCGKRDGAKKCAQCKVVAYCGRECQKKDWKAHKRICAIVAKPVD